MIKILIFLLLITAGLRSEAYSGQSLTWQKVALEEKIRRKLDGLLATVIKENQYIVETDVKVSDPGKPNFGNDSATGTKVSEITMSESSGDYIAFSKVGLEVPVLEKYFDEDKTKLMNLYRFNEAYDIFKNLDGINVKISISDKLKPQQIEIVKKVVDASKISFADVKPTITYETIEMEWTEEEKKQPPKNTDEEKVKKQEEPKIWKKDWLEWASRWGNAVGLIVAFSVFGFILLSIFRQYKMLMEKLAEIPKKEEPKKEEIPLDTAATEVQEEVTKDDLEDDVATANGFIRFQQCLLEHPDNAVDLVRQWLSAEDQNSITGIRAISQQLESKDIEFIMLQLSHGQKEKWKTHLNQHLTNQELKDANRYIFQQVVSALLVPSTIQDGELLNLIVELTPGSTIQFLKKYPQHVPLLMNVLGASMLSKVLEQLDSQSASEWLVRGAEFNQDTLGEMLPELKNDIKTYNNAWESPYAKRIMDLIPSAKFAMENSLYETLSKVSTPKKLEEVARKYLPAELVPALPSNIIKDILTAFPMNKRVEIIATRSKEIQETIMDSLATKGSTAREMMDMELDTILKDKMKYQEVLSRQDEIWQSFIDGSRLYLQKNPSYQQTIKDLVVEWARRFESNIKELNSKKAA